MMDISGKPMFAHVFERTWRAETIDQIVVATTIDPSDDPVVDFCSQHNFPFYRGSLFDVLDRYYHAALIFNPDTIVRITADCPIIDPEVIDRTVNAFWGIRKPQDVELSIRASQRSNNPIWTNTIGMNISKDEKLEAYDFTTNRLPPPWGRTYPVGLDTEVCSMNNLEIAWREATEPHQREHVMPYFYDHLERFRVLLVNHDPDYGKLRWTVDTSADLELIRLIFSSFPGRNNFSWTEILNLFSNNPELGKINAGVKPKNYLQIDHRIDE